MKEYIEREIAIGAVEYVACRDLRVYSSNAAYPKIMKALNEAPAADVAPVVHGEWNIKSEIIQMPDDVDEEIYVECPYCKRTFYVPFEFEDEKILAYARENYPYCHCGAKMDGDTKKEVGFYKDLKNYNISQRLANGGK